MLKIVVPLERLISDRLEVDDDKGSNGAGGDDIEIAKKSKKSKGQKLSKS